MKKKWNSDISQILSQKTSKLTSILIDTDIAIGVERQCHQEAAGKLDGFYATHHNHQ